jgi:hypothetical protein
VLAIAAVLFVLALLTLLVGAVWIAIPAAIVALAVLVASRTGIGRRGPREPAPRA